MTIDDRKKIVTIVAVDHRKDVYERVQVKVLRQ